MLRRLQASPSSVSSSIFLSMMSPPCSTHLVSPLRRMSAAEERAEKKKKAQEKWKQHDDWNADPFTEEADYEAEPLEDPYEDLIAAHRILGTRPGDPLYRVKLSYMMRCRDTHPEIDGNPATFYKISLAYERILKDRGIEMRDGRIQFSESLPLLPHGHDPMADASRQVLIKAAEEVPGYDRYERSEALERLREARMMLAGTSAMFTHPDHVPVSEMKAIERLELVHDILLTPQALKGLPWFQQPHRMSVAEIAARDGKDVADAFEAIAAPAHLQLDIGGVEEPTELLEEGGENGNTNNNNDNGSIEAGTGGEKSQITNGNNSSNKEVTSNKSENNKQVTENGNGSHSSSSAAKTGTTALSTDRQSAKQLQQARLLKDPTFKEITPELLMDAAEIDKKVEETIEKGASHREIDMNNDVVLKWRSAVPTLRVTEHLGPGTAVVQARQFEAIARRGKVTTYARYAVYPHPPRPLSKLPSDLEEHHSLRPEEEEAVARTVINKQLEEGKIHPHTVLNYLYKSSSVAGMAAQTATTWMNSTEESKSLFVEFSFFLAAALALSFCALATLAAYIRYQRVFGVSHEKKRKLQEYINLDTMLPWWGNDATYEENVKRIFLEEYRIGRQQAEQHKNYQAGMDQEGKTNDEKMDRELQIFEVSKGDVKKMRERVMKKTAPDETFDGRTGEVA